MGMISLVLSGLSAFMGIWMLVRTPSGLVGGMLWLPKLWAGSWAPFLGMAGALGALLGLGVGSPLSVGLGLFGAVAASISIVRAIAPHNEFAQAFGQDWKARIPPGLAARMPRQRYTLIQPEPRIGRGHRDLTLRAGDEAGGPLLADLWEPADGVPRTGLALVFLHGGLWQALDKDFLTQPLFRRLAGQGHVVLDVAHSLAPAADMSHILADVKQAIAWMKTHAAEYGVDPGRIVLLGASGGGHLALLAAYTPNDPAFQPDDVLADTSVRAVVSIFGVTDLTAFFEEYGRANPRQPQSSAQITGDLRPRVYDKTFLDRLMTRTRAFPTYRHGNMPGGPLLLVYLLGGTLKEAPEAYRHYSPIAHVGPHCPPTLQLLADNDFAVDASHGRRLDHALRTAGIPSIYIEYPGTVHGFDQYFGVSRRIAPAAQVATYDLEQFLALMFA